MLEFSLLYYEEGLLFVCFRNTKRKRKKNNCNRYEMGEIEFIII